MRPSRLSCPGRALGRVAIVLFFSLCLLAIASSVEAAPTRQASGTGEQIFQSKCTGCHTIGKGKLVGPDLQGVTQRRDSQWLHTFISDPSKMFAAKDPTATQLLAENNNVQMPTLGLSPADVDAVINYLAAVAGTSGGQATPAPAPAAAPADPAAGERLFTGQQRLANAGPPCITCHSVSGAGALGGGALGPDLTHVAQRYSGATGLTPVLTTIAFPTMVGPFTSHALTPQEVADLVAFFVQQDTAQAPVPQFARGSLTPDFWRVLVIGIVGAAILTLLLFIFWPRQRQSISDRLRNSARGNR